MKVEFSVWIPKEFREKIKKVLELSDEDFEKILESITKDDIEKAKKYLVGVEKTSTRFKIEYKKLRKLLSKQKKLKCNKNEILIATIISIS